MEVPLHRNSSAILSSLLAMAGLLAFAAAPAMAIQAEVQGTTLVLRPDAGEAYPGQVSKSSDGGGEYVQVSSSGSDTVNGGPGCTPLFNSTSFYKCRTAAGGTDGGIALIDMEGTGLD